ncbi:hypothetical protein KKA02_02365 [Patescibacteria group bacterium]|nr:hypothetical protein [Patescibacteria group bacterium]
MYTKRTNVLLTEDMYDFLIGLANEKGVTMAELIRRAVEKSYVEVEKKKGKKTGKKKSKNINYELLNGIKSCWKYLKNPEKPVDYKAWVEYGRK